jgi:formyl-CoA transferase/CoA:oxalate CoA-transferase
MGNAHLAFAPYRLFSTSDGYIDIACGNDSLYHKFCDALELGQLKNDPRYLKNKDRMANRDQLNKILEPVLRQKTTAEWCAILAKAGVPSGPIRTTVDIFTDPVLQQNGDILDLEHSKAGTIKILGNPVRMSEISVEYCPAPELGANSEEILQRLGYSPKEISTIQGKTAI